MDRLTETKMVKDALTKEGYTSVKVGHGSGTARGWLHIKCDEKFIEQTWQEKSIDVEMIARQVTGRTGDYGGRITIS